MSGGALVWTGRLEFDLKNGRGFPIATVDVSVRRDIAIFWIGTRTIAVVDRDRLRDWFARPYVPFAIDDIEFVLLGSDMCITIDGSIPYVLPHWISNQLATLVGDSTGCRGECWDGAMTLDQYLDLARLLPDVEVDTPGPGSEAPEVAWGDSFIAYRAPDPLPGDDREFPFATVVTKDYPGFDTSSQLDREGVVRLNFSVGRHEYERLLGHPPAEHDQHRTEYDPAAIGVLIPHPAYAVQGWVSMVCAGEMPGSAESLLTFAHRQAAERHRLRRARLGGHSA